MAHIYQYSIISSIVWIKALHGLSTACAIISTCVSTSTCTIVTIAPHFAASGTQSSGTSTIATRAVCPWAGTGSTDSIRWNLGTYCGSICARISQAPYCCAFCMCFFVRCLWYQKRCWHGSLWMKIEYPAGDAVRRLTVLRLRFLTLFIVHGFIHWCSWYCLSRLGLIYLGNRMVLQWRLAKLGWWFSKICQGYFTPSGCPCGSPFHFAGVLTMYTIRFENRIDFHMMFVLCDLDFDSDIHKTHKRATAGYLYPAMLLLVVWIVPSAVDVFQDPQNHWCTEEKAIEKLHHAIGATYQELKESLREDTKGQNHDTWRYCWWLKSSKHQLRLVFYPSIYRVLYIPGGAGFLPSTAGRCSRLELKLSIEGASWGTSQ